MLGWGGQATLQPLRLVFFEELRADVGQFQEETLQWIRAFESQVMVLSGRRDRKPLIREAHRFDEHFRQQQKAFHNTTQLVVEGLWKSASWRCPNPYFDELESRASSVKETYLVSYGLMSTEHWFPRGDFSETPIKPEEFLVTFLGKKFFHGIHEGNRRESNRLIHEASRLRDERFACYPVELVRKQTKELRSPGDFATQLKYDLGILRQSLGETFDRVEKRCDMFVRTAECVGNFGFRVQGTTITHRASLLDEG